MIIWCYEDIASSEGYPLTIFGAEKLKKKKI